MVAYATPPISTKLSHARRRAGRSHTAFAPQYRLYPDDDHRYNFTGALGHPWLKGHTPNMDRMVNNGVHFRNAFVTSSLCSPSRATILTSLYMHSHNVTENFSPLNPRLPTFPQLLRQNGYRTGFFGKWHATRALGQPARRDLATSDRADA